MGYASGPFFFLWPEWLPPWRGFAEPISHYLRVLKNSQSWSKKPFFISVDLILHSLLSCDKSTGVAIPCCLRGNECAHHQECDLDGLRTHVPVGFFSSGIVECNYNGSRVAHHVNFRWNIRNYANVIGQYGSECAGAFQSSAVILLMTSYFNIWSYIPKGNLPTLAGSGLVFLLRCCF